ncbi:MAG: DUF2079 domain-containing protein [Candidatus Zhuqueibacterota bacterium]
MQRNTNMLPRIGLSASAIAYTAIIGHWAGNRFFSFNATFWDLGIMIQSIWNTAHGRVLHESINMGISTSRIAVAHWEFIYLPLALIFRLFHSVPLLLHIQTATLALGVFPIYLFARKRLASETSGVLIAIAYLFYPALHGANLFDLHGLTFASTFLLYAFYFLDRGSVSGTIIFALLSISCREDVAIAVFMLGVYAILFKKMKRIGLPLISLGAIWLMLFYLRGHLFATTEILSETSAASNWSHLGDHGIFSLFTAPLLRPAYFLHTLFSAENMLYLIKLLLPLLGMCLLAPAILMICLPTLLLNLLSDWSPMRQIEYQYTAAITPFLFLAAVQGLAHLTKRLNRPSLSGEKKHRILLVASGAILVASMFATGHYSILRFHRTWQPAENQIALSGKLRSIAPEHSVSATARLGPHLAARQNLYHFPQHADSVDIVCIELNRPGVEIRNPAGKFPTAKVPAMNAHTRSALSDTSLGLLFEQDDIFCMQRHVDPRESFAQWAISDELPQETRPVVTSDLGDGITCRGWKPIYIDSRQAYFRIYWEKSETWRSGRGIQLVVTMDGRSHELTHQPVFGRFALQDWPVNAVICDALFIDNPAPASEGQRDLAVEVSTESGNYPLFTFRFE